MSLPKVSSESVGQHRPDFRSSVVADGVFVTFHARERLRLHHPNAGVRGALALLDRSTEVEPGFIAPFIGRRAETLQDRYFVATDRSGVFVVARSFEGGTFPWALVTYLRFGQYQQEVAERLLGAA